MADIPRTALFGKLNDVAYRAIESATVFCKMRGNPYVELVHWLHQILQIQDTDLHRIIARYEIEPGRLAKDVTDALDRLPRGASSISDLSAHVEEAVERGWVYGTLLLDDPQVRTGYLVLGAVKTRGLRSALESISTEFRKVRADELADRFHEIVEGSVESGLSARDGFAMAGEPGEASGAMAPSRRGDDALAQFTTDLTEQARAGELDPIVGRDEEIRQMVDILMRRRQNNPLLTGEAGVGKTAVVEGFAQRIVRGDVPEVLRDVAVRTLDIGLLQAGASMKGEFENRLRQVIEAVQSSEKPIILFIDEAHTLIGAGGAAGTGDAANLLKPALARGQLRTIAATTWAEYKKHIEKDPALTRRFQVIQVKEPDEDRAGLMMRGIAGVMESHHRVQVLDEAVMASVRLSHRYIPARQLPDKSVSLLDTACARVAVSQHAVPAPVDDLRKKAEALATELQIIGREEAAGFDVASRRTAVESRLEETRGELAAIEARWERERELVTRVLDLRARLRGEPATGEPPGAGAAEAAAGGEPAEGLGDVAAVAEAAAAMPEPPSGAEREALLEQLAEADGALAEMQGEQPLIHVTVNEDAVASVVADWTGIPVGRMVRDEVQAVLELEHRLGQRVVGQDHGLRMIARRIRTSRAQLDNPDKPIGVFMLAGPSGVGKTETALTLAETLYGGEQNVITINMSEFQEAHTVSTLKGSPPGYVGYGEGGVLTEAVRRRPYSVVLLDEVEKAHPDVHEIFFQVFDKGRMEDGEGRMIDFKNTVILLTSNVGTDRIMSLCKDPELLPDPEALAQGLREPLLEVFPPALLGRMVVIPYYPLSDDMIRRIALLQLGRIARRTEAAHGVPLTWDEAVLDVIAARCTEVESGGRMIDAILTNTVLPRMSEHVLGALMEGRPVTRMHLGADGSEFTYDFA